MELEGVMTVSPDQEELIEGLAAMMGETYEEEPYTKAFLEGIRAKDGQGLAISTTIMRALITAGAAHGRVLCTPDANACVLAYRASEQTKPHMDFVEASIKAAQDDPCLGAKQAPLVFLQNVIMMPVADFEWYPEIAGDGVDYIHISHAGVRTGMQHQGEIDRILNPLLAYADANGLSVFTETYSQENEELFKHFGFHTIEVLESPTTPLKERCMARQPQ